MGIKYGVNWKKIINGVSSSIKSVTPRYNFVTNRFIVRHTWLVSGIVPSMIYYGLQILNPEIFLFMRCYNHSCW